MSTDDLLIILGFLVVAVCAAIFAGNDKDDGDG